MSLTEKEIDEQEHLTDDRIGIITNQECDWNFGREDRPKSSLIDLMHWTKANVASRFKTDLTILVHNKIVIDGPFLQFCKENKISVKCLMQDAMATWQSDNDCEHFMAQGVFEISIKGLKFIHAALFHKGNQNEDEVSFFILVETDKINKYIALRNQYDQWLLDRDRDSLEVHVVGGESYSYSKDLLWKDVFLPESLKNEIISSVSGFIDAKPLYEEMKIAWKRGVLFYGEPGNGKTTIIKTIMSTYDFKPVTVQASSSTNDEVITEAFQYAQEQGPSLLCFEDLDTMIGSRLITLSHFLNLMDGISAREGILVVATANDPSKLGQAILDRPSRFDRKWEIPLPDEDMSKAYLKNWFGNILKAKQYSDLASRCVRNNFSYAYLKELYITSACNALAAGRKKPIQEDIEIAIKQMTRDKENYMSGFESETKTQIGII